MDKPVKGEIVHTTDRGFGFIAIPGMDKNVFFHARDLMGSASMNLVTAGMSVSVERIEETPKGLVAHGVLIL